MLHQDREPHELRDAREEHEAGELAQTHPLWRKCLAEFVGTAFLIYIGCGSLTASGYLAHDKALFTGADLLGVALAFGLALGIMVYALSHISGSHINPAVSIAMATTRRMSWREAGAYVVSQLLGGLLGALLIAVCFGARSARTLGYGATDYNTLFVNYFGAIVTEAIVTFFLMFVIMAMVMDKRTPAGWAGLMVGLTLGVAILVTGAITGGNLNPARAFGPTIIELLFGASYPFWHMFVFFIGPIIGAIGGAFAYEYLAGIALARQAKRVPYGRLEPGD